MPLDEAAELQERTSRSVAHAFRNLAAGEALNKGARFLSAAILARTLDARGFGSFNVGVAVAGIATAATGLGAGEVAGRQAAIDPTRSARLAGRVLAVRAVAIVPLVLVAILVSAIVAPARLPVVAAVGLFATGTASSADWLGRALQRTAGVGAAAGLGGVVALCAAGIVLVVHGSYVAALAGFALAEFVTSVLCWRAVRDIGRPRPSLSGSLPLLRRSWPVGISSLVVYSYYANLDTLILSATHGPDKAGIYSGAYRVFLLFNTVALFGAYANFPTLSRASADPNDKAAGRVLHRSLVYLFAYGGLVTGGTLIWGGQLLGLLFGPGFQSAGPTLVLLCVGVGWYVVGYPLGYNLIARDQNRLFMTGAVVAGILSVGLDLLLIPPYGMVGAGAANAVAFAGASLAWTGAYGSRDGALLLVLVGLGLLSIIAILGLTFNSLAVPAGVVIGGLSVAIVVVYKAQQQLHSRPASR